MLEVKSKKNGVQEASQIIDTKKNSQNLLERVRLRKAVAENPVETSLNNNTQAQAKIEEKQNKTLPIAWGEKISNQEELRMQRAKAEEIRMQHAKAEKQAYADAEAQEKAASAKLSQRRKQPTKLLNRLEKNPTTPLTLGVPEPNNVSINEEEGRLENKNNVAGTIQRQMNATGTENNNNSVTGFLQRQMNANGIEINKTLAQNNNTFNSQNMSFENLKQKRIAELTTFAVSIGLPKNYVGADIFENVENKEKLNELFNNHKMLLEVMKEMPNTNTTQFKSEMHKFNEQQRETRIVEKEPKSYLLGSNQLPNSKSPGHPFYPKAGTYPPPRDFVKPPSVDYSKKQLPEYHGVTLPTNTSQSRMKTSASVPQFPHRDLLQETQNYAERSKREHSKLVNARKQTKKEVSISNADKIVLSFNINYEYKYNNKTKTIDCDLKKEIIDEKNIQEKNKELLKKIIKHDDKKKLAKSLIDKIFRELVTHKDPFINKAQVCRYFKNNSDKLERCIGLFFNKAFGFDLKQRPKEIEKFLSKTKFEKMFEFPEDCHVDVWKKGGKKITKKNRKRNRPIKTRKNKKTNQSKKKNKKPIQKLTKKKSKSSRV